MSLDATVARVQIAFVEILKLREHVMSTPDTVLTAAEIFASLEWMQDAAQGAAARRTASLDWTSLTPADRDTMLQAKRIQDRLLAYAPHH